MTIPRLHLFEVEDSPLLPSLLRDMMTEYLHWVMDIAGPYDPAAARIALLLQQAGTKRVVDLASGGAGPWPRLLPSVTLALGAMPQVTLTDLHPNAGAFARVEQETRGAIRGRAQSVDATQVPPELAGVRTMFTGLHHLAPGQVRALMRDAAAQRQPLLAFELTQRTPLGILMMFASLLLVLGSAPFIKPFRLERLVLTYLIPILPLCIVWDGVVSALRSYTQDELRAFASEVAAPGYEWEVGEHGGVLMPLTHLIGRPV
ncbi:MAG: class I SAM-dependent methyltransferase [Gemmatimonadaceae bacterium]